MMNRFTLGVLYSRGALDQHLQKYRDQKYTHSFKKNVWVRGLIREDTRMVIVREESFVLTIPLERHIAKLRENN